jgi:hypothetical protein
MTTTPAPGVFTALLGEGTLTDHLHCHPEQRDLARDPALR